MSVGRGSAICGRCANSPNPSRERCAVNRWGTLVPACSASLLKTDGGSMGSAGSAWPSCSCARCAGPCRWHNACCDRFGRGKQPASRHRAHVLLLYADCRAVQIAIFQSRAAPGQAGLNTQAPTGTRAVSLLAPRGSCCLTGSPPTAARDARSAAAHPAGRPPRRTQSPPRPGSRPRPADRRWRRGAGRSRRRRHRIRRS